MHAGQRRIDALGASFRRTLLDPLETLLLAPIALTWGTASIVLGTAVL